VPQMRACTAGLESGRCGEILVQHIANILLMLIALFALSVNALADTASECKLMVWEGELADAVPVCQQAAKTGDAYAQNFLGVIYADGQLVKQDAKQSTAWFQLAAKQWYAPAQANLGMAYASGFGVKQNAEQARIWWRKAAEQGDALAIRSLGLPDGDKGEGIQQFAAKMFYRAGVCRSEGTQRSGEHSRRNQSCAVLVEKIRPNEIHSSACVMR